MTEKRSKIEHKTPHLHPYNLGIDVWSDIFLFLDFKTFCSWATSKLVRKLVIRSFSLRHRLVFADPIPSGRALILFTAICPRITALSVHSTVLFKSKPVIPVSPFVATCRQIFCDKGGGKLGQARKKLLCPQTYFMKTSKLN